MFLINSNVNIFVAILLAGFFLGSLDTASNSLVLYMLGPLRSPPFTQSLHAMVALGFTLGSLVVRPYLPDNDQGSSDNVCDGFAQNDTINSNTTAFISNDSPDPSVSIDAKNIPNLVWPFSIICLVHIVCAAGYLSIGKSQMSHDCFTNIGCCSLLRHSYAQVL